ncbi:MAG: UPF0164 family protein [Planctomycetes bacterium]|nr:UPF0164 family protein [Planctomycetota bacterium]
MKKLIILLMISLLFSGWSAFAANPNLGTSGAQFLKIPIGARAAGLGSAYIALVDDASAIFWNPAGTVNGNYTHSTHISTMEWFEYFRVNSVSYSYRLSDVNAFSVGVQVLAMDEMEITTEHEPNGNGMFFDAQDLALTLSYAHKLTDRFQMGVSAKYINQKIWNETANGIAFDVGTQYHIAFRNMAIAMSMTHFGPDLKMSGPDLNITYDRDDYLMDRLVPSKLDTESYPLPLSFDFGIAFDLYASRFTTIKAAIDALHPNDNAERLHLGTEVSFYDRLFLRSGYKIDRDYDEDYNFGLGVNIFPANTLFQFDYAYSLYNILPDVHRFSIGLRF